MSQQDPHRAAAASNTTRRNIHIHRTTFVHQSRILKSTDTLISNGVFTKVLILAFWKPGSPEREMLDERREVHRVRTTGLSRTSRALMELEWQFRVFWKVLRSSPDCINCHNIWLLPLCVLLKLCTSCRLVYDTHELETETWNSLGLRKQLSKVVERAGIRFADLVIVVSESIADWYRDKYALTNVHVVRNLPASRVAPARTTALREMFDIRDDELLFLYQGLVSGGRGIEILLEGFAKTSPDKHVVFLGYGPQVELIQSYVARYANIHFVDAVPPSELPRMTRSADVGLSLIENVSLSYYYCLPNKLFEYLSCGLPVIVSDFPEMGAVVNQHDCGWTSDASIDGLSSVLSTITRQDVEAKSRSVSRCMDFFTWEQEEPALLAAYQATLPFPPLGDQGQQSGVAA